MEYCEGGDMKTLLRNCKKNRDYIAEDVIWKIFSQILLALNECHNKKSGKVLHRDLKPANIFLDAQNNIKLGDFGLSRMMGDQSVFAYTYVGTPYYMSPEQITESKYNEKSDIWSAGCLLYEIAALRPPFEASNHLSLAMKIKSGKFERIPIRYSESLQKVLEMMININPTARPTAEQLLTVPHISIRVQEKKLKDKAAQMKSREKELNKREEALKELSEMLDRKEKELREIETRLNEKKLSLMNNEMVNSSFNSQTPSVTSELNTRSSNNWEKKMNAFKDRQKENDYAYKGNRPVSRGYEPMLQNYKMKAHGRGLSGEYSDTSSNFNTRRSQEFSGYTLK